MELFPWHLGVYDAHCHATDIMSSIDKIPAMKAAGLAIMATRAQDQDLVAQVADKLGFEDYESSKVGTSEQRIVPCFGWHPWFSHQIYDDSSDGSTQPKGDTAWKHDHYQDVLVPRPEELAFLEVLPEPRPLLDLIAKTRKYLEKYPLALVGEIGLDKAFCLPTAWTPEKLKERDTSLTPGGREGRLLSPYRVSIAHQKKVLKAQLDLAAEMQRAVSVHSVQAHGLTLEVLQETWRGYEKQVISKRSLKRRVATGQASDAGSSNVTMVGSEDKGPKPYPPRICLHSYSGTLEAMRDYFAPSVPADIYFSFSTVVNFSTSSNKAIEVVKKVPEDQLLIESDLHHAGERMDGYLEEITRLICGIRGWTLEEGVTKLARNWRRFIFGQDDLSASFCSDETTSTMKFIL